MGDVLAMAGGILVALLGIWFGYWRAGRTLPPELREAMRLERSDPPRAEFLVDKYFMAEAARDEAERAQLWKRAPSDLAAAEELRRRLEQDLETDAEAQPEFRKSASPELLRTLAEGQRASREQIAKLEETIRRLRGV